MRLVALLALGLALLALALLGTTTPEATVTPVATARTRPSVAPKVERERQTLTRDPFRYVDARGAAATPNVPPQITSTMPPSAVSAPRPVRLIGFVRGEELRAALVIDGEVVLAAAGERPLGYEVIEVDEDAGVNIRTPSGEMFTLVPF